VVGCGIDGGPATENRDAWLFEMSLMKSATRPCPCHLVGDTIIAVGPSVRPAATSEFFCSDTRRQRGRTAMTPA
jgi:hypothetical protein